MKTPVAYLSRQSPVNLAIGAAIVVGVVYLLGRQTIKDVVGAAGGIVSGDNLVTRNQTNLGGETVTAYENKGIFGTLGAAANSASGGILASAGETLGGWAFDVFGPKTGD